MLVVFSPIFVADTKINFRYDFVAPLRQCMLVCQSFCNMLIYQLNLRDIQFAKVYHKFIVHGNIEVSHKYQIFIKFTILV